MIAALIPFEQLRQLAAIVTGTFASEDLTCISVGLLIRESKLDPLVGVLGCLVGIVAGDLGLWFVGRVAGRGVLSWGWVEKRLPPAKREALERWLGERCGRVVLAARFLPGTRTVLFLAAGGLGIRPRAFLSWTLAAALLWTPLLVLGVSLVGQVAVEPLTSILGGFAGVALTALGLLGLLHLMAVCLDADRRARLVARVSRLWRWEFWPSWLFYLPLVPWLGLLALRYRSFTVWTAANPGIPLGGVVGESKSEILSKLPARFVVPTLLIESGTSAERFQKLAEHLRRSRWYFPMILKPDAGQRGAGVKRVHSLDEAAAYLAENSAGVIVQPWHPGPFEAGIFYYRRPGEAQGRIFSITDKRFPVAVGDGTATLEQLIWRHPRLRMQAGTFLARYADQRDRVLAPGETMPLAVAGNHCQGTLFQDGSHLITPALERQIDSIARHFPGFYFGRFDVRYTGVAAFQAGEDMAIVELNGATSESTNLYDPAKSLLAAYHILFRQWGLLFDIGNRNRRRGIQPPGAWKLIRLVRDYFRQTRPHPLAD